MSILQKTTLILRILLGLLFLFAAVTKVIYFDKFVGSVADFGIIWDPAVTPFSIVLVVAELFGGVGLFFKRRWSFVLIATLLISFIGALSYGKYLGLDIDCGCFGPAYKVGLLTQIIIDVIILFCLLVVFWEGRFFKTELTKTHAEK